MSDSKPNIKDIDLKPKVHPLVASLPNHLKDPRNYKKIKKLILESLAGKCSHGEVVEWATCEKCQRRFRDRRHLLRKLGFTHPAQYMVWQQIHEEIRVRTPLINWDEENAKRALEDMKKPNGT